MIAADINQPRTSIAMKSERRRRLARRPYQAIARLISTVAAAYTMAWPNCSGRPPAMKLPTALMKA